MVSMNGYTELVFIFDPTGYEASGGPFYLGKKLLDSIDGLNDKGEQQQFILTDFYVLNSFGDKARLYVPEGMKARETGLDIKPVLRLVR